MCAGNVCELLLPASPVVVRAKADAHQSLLLSTMVRGIVLYSFLYGTLCSIECDSDAIMNAKEKVDVRKTKELEQTTGLVL